MTEEIKRIIEELKDNIPIEEYRSEGTSDGSTHYEEDKDSWQYKLLDYITNLQQKLEQYEKTQTYGDYVEKLNKIVELQQENKILKELNICVGCENNPDYKSRCEKAIEYVKENYPTSTINYQDDKYKLMNILNGSDENE